METPDEWVQPEEEPFNEEDNLQEFLLQAECYDQYVVRAGHKTSVHMNKRVSDDVMIL